tara:strand:+ start:66731 stop:70159 length:3429 start_codon:yes stop_codon:yes gene_type:complete
VAGQPLTGVNPKNNEFLSISTPSFQWNTSNATTYTIEISTDPVFSNIVHTEMTSDHFITISTSLNSGKYYWRIFDGGNFSPIYSFNIFTPSDDSDLEAWLDPTFGITQDGMGKISSWSDINGGYLFDQVTYSKQPSFEPNGLGGHPEIVFNGGQVLEGGDVLDLNLEDESIFVVSQTTGNEQTLISKSIFAGQPSRYSLFRRNGQTQFLYHDNANRTTLVDTVVNNYALYQVGINRSINQAQCRVNNSDVQTTAGLVNGYNMNSNFRFLIGAYNNSNDNGEIWQLNGSISEIIIVNSTSSNSVENIRGYLRYKYMPKLDLGYDISMYGFCDTTLYAGDRFDSYLWSDGSTADSLVVSEPGTYWVETIDIFGFTSVDTVEVTYPVFNYPAIQTYCPSDSITWHTNFGQDYNYLWSDGSNADSLSIDSPGDYFVEITDTNGCVFQSDTLTFDEDPFESIVTLGPDQNLCTGNTLTLQDGDSLAVDYLWNTSSTDSAIVLNSSGTYYLDVVNENGCEASDTIDITIIGDAPIVSIGAPANVCEGAEFSFEDLSNTTDGSLINSWNWDLSDGTIISVDDSSHIYNTNGTFNIELTVSTTAGCSNTTSQQIDVIPKPEMTFVSSNECQNSLIQFNGGQLTPTQISSWEWNFDDIISGANNVGFGQNATHVYENAGDYDVMLVGTDINGCIDTVIQTTTIIPAPQVDFDFAEVCEGDVVNFVNETTIDPPGVIVLYNWDFGDGTNSGQFEPQKPYNVDGTYTVSLTANSNNGCMGQSSQSLKVHANPIIDQVIESSCAGLNTTFIDNSFVSNGSVGQVYWSFNNGAPVQGFEIDEIFEDPGTVQVEQTVLSGFGCTNSQTFNVEIEDYLDASFDYFPNAFIAGTPIDFSSTSIGADQYEWDFESLGNSVQPDTTIVFPESSIGDLITVQLAVENSFGCRDSIIVENPVLERSTDLEVNELFLQEQNGFYTVGVRLTNKGTTPINEVELVYNSPNQSPIQETWEGLLLAGETTIYVFGASPSSAVPLEDSTQNFSCVRGTISAPTIFTETDLSNNEACTSIEPSSTVLVAPQPNPIGEIYTVRVIVTTPQTGSLMVYDVQGRKVDIIFENHQLEKGLNTFEVDASQYANGGYTLQYTGQQLIHVKMIKQ